MATAKAKKAKKKVARKKVQKSAAASFSNAVPAVEDDAEEEIDSAIKAMTPKTGPALRGGTRAARIADKIRKKHAKKKPENRPAYETVIFDPNESLEVATSWVDMPFPWQDLTGVRGVAFGHITTILGKPDSGKTTIAMHAMVEAQIQGYIVVLIDTEFKFNFDRFKNMGGDVSALIVIRARSIEGGFGAIDETMQELRAEDPDTPILYVWDSLGMTPTDAELAAKADEVGVAGGARVIKRNIRREVAKIYATKTAIVFINHVYDKIGVLFGNPTTGYGGSGPMFASVLTLEVQRIKAVTSKKGGKKHQVAVVSGIRCTKNHLSSVQGGAVQVKIGPTGIVQGDVKKLHEAAQNATDLAGISDDELDDEERELGL